MRSLHFLDPEVTRKLLEGHVDILTPAAQEQESFLTSQSCPRCGGSCRKIADARTVFREQEMLPHYYLQCLACECEFDPRTGMIIEMGNLAKAGRPAIPIIGKSTESHE